MNTEIQQVHFFTTFHISYSSLAAAGQEDAAPARAGRAARLLCGGTKPGPVRLAVGSARRSVVASLQTLSQGVVVQVSSWHGF